MALPSKAVLRRNTIVPSMAPNKLVCSICLVDQNSKDWNSHIAKQSHVKTLEFFSRTFENREDGALCKICQSDVPWDTVKTHAKSHMIIPWYEPEDQYRIFYENHTLKFSAKYYCYLCDKIFHDWSTIYAHIGRDKHQKIVQEIRQSVPMSGSKRFYIDLIAGGFVPKIGGIVECRFCDETDLAYHVTAKHATAYTHLQNKKKFIDDLLKRIDNEDSSKPIVEVPETNESAPSVSEPRVSNENNVSSTTARRMICNFLLEPETTISDKNDDPPISLRQPEEEKLSVASNSLDWVEKVPELFHEYNADYIVSSASALCDEARALNGEKKKRRRAKQITEDPDPYCLICCFAIPGHPAVLDHVTGSRHVISRRKYGCDSIVCIEANWYYCRSCDRTVTGFENLYRHLIDNSHTRLIDQIIPNDEKISVAENTPSESMGISREANNAKNQNCIYIVRRNARKSFCQICDDTEYPIATKNIKDHMESERHKDALTRYGCENIIANGSNYHCRCCNLQFSALENVYLHVKDKRHTSSMIKVSGKQKPQTRKRIRDNFETQEYFEEIGPPSGNNLLSDYIVNQIPSYSLNDFPELGGRRTNDFSPQSDVENAFGGNAAQPEATNSFWVFPKRHDAARQSMPRGEPYVYHNTIGINNNNGQSPAANSFWKFPSRIQIAMKSNNTQINFRNSQTNLSNNREAQKNSFDFYGPSIGTSNEQYPSRPEFNSMLSSMAGDLSKFLELSEASQSRNAPIPSLFDDIGNSFVKKINCNLCDVSVTDMTQLHVHMANHFSEDFVRPKRNRYGNSGINDYSNNETNPRNFVDNSQSTEHPNQGNVIRNNSVQDTRRVNGSRSPENPINLPIETLNSDNTKPDDFARFLPNEKINNPQKLHQSPKRTSVKKIIEILDFDDDYIYEIKEKTAEIELGIRLSLTINATKIYCLICRKIVECTLTNYYEHLCSVDHCEYLELMERDFERFDNIEGQFSDLDLAQEYMEETSDEAVRCFVCDLEIANSEESIEQHIYEAEHSRKCLETQTRAMMNFQILKPRLDCDWYKVQKYWCVVCLTNTESEVNFVKHLRSNQHARNVNKSENRGKRLIYDFCATCALLWYGYRCTHSYHSDIPSHQWLSRDGHFVLSDLSKFTKMLLANPEKFVEDKVNYLNEIYEAECRREEKIITDLERAVRTKFSRAKAYCFGSRATGLASPDSDVDVYLDCRNLYDGNDTSDLQLYFINGVNECLNKNPQSWDVEEVLTTCRCPIIRAYHRATGLKCDISFQNGLSVENTKLIKTYITVFPICRKLILFLKKWSTHCELVASRAITSYALYWFVIFYLQNESILPSVATLIAMSKKSHIIAGWEVSVSQNFAYNERASNYSITEFLMRFFKFYANFDFRHCVACPLLGEELTKREFVEPENLPNVMMPYIDYLRISGKYADPFRIDSVMCIQDPFNLRHNLTEAVGKSYLNRFRTCCLKSLDYLSLPSNST